MRRFFTRARPLAAKATAPPRHVPLRGAAPSRPLLALAALLAASSAAALEGEEPAPPPERAPAGQEEGEGEEGEGDAPASSCPGDFSHREEERSFNIYPSEGLTLSLQSSIGGGGGRDGGFVASQMFFTPAGAQSVFIAADQRGPTLQATLMPPAGPEGRSLRLSTAGQPAPGVALEADAVLHNSGAVQSGKVGAKWSGDDFHATLALNVPLGGQGGGPIGDLAYHQSLGRGTGATAGGTLHARLSPDAPVLAPVVQHLLWGAFGSWTSAREDSALFARVSQQPTQEGTILHALAVQAWHRAGRALELGADFSANSGGESGAGLGARMTFHGADRPQNLAPVLTAHVSSGLVASVSLVTPTAGLASSSFLRTTVSAVLDHKKRDYKMGVGVELYY